MAVPNLKRARMERGITQKKLAELSGVNRGTIAYYETVAEINPSHVMLRKLADALGVTPSDLVDEGRKNPIFDWREDYPEHADFEILSGVPPYALERPEVKRIIKKRPKDRRLELLKLWEFMPSEQHRVTVLSLFYGEEDLSHEFGTWEALIPAQRRWEERFFGPKRKSPERKPKAGVRALTKTSSERKRATRKKTKSSTRKRKSTHATKRKRTVVR